MCPRFLHILHILIKCFMFEEVEVYLVQRFDERKIIRHRGCVVVCPVWLCCLVVASPVLGEGGEKPTEEVVVYYTFIVKSLYYYHFHRYIMLSLHFYCYIHGIITLLSLNRCKCILNSCFYLFLSFFQ